MTVIQPEAHLSLKKAYQWAKKDKEKISLSNNAQKRIAACRQYIEQKLSASNDAYYGINTGFGLLCDIRVNDNELAQLQRNLLLSHAVGTGAEVPPQIVRLMLLLKAQSLSYGHSGVCLDTVQCLLNFYNHDILPVVYEQGSLGASGDLAPLAHLSLPCIGIGEVRYKGKKMPASEALKKAKLKPINLAAKEGLALINGTQFMSAYSVWCVSKAKNLAKYADRIAAMSLDAYDAHTAPLLDAIHQIRKQRGQIKSAARLLHYLEGSAIAQLPKKQVQDCYSFRCIPQVHGASLDAINYAKKIIEREINAVTDNPLVFENIDLIVSGGNFHGQPLALSLDFLGIALAELGNLSERRTYKLLDGTRRLPVFLTENSGLNSGLMMLQYTAAALVSQNKQLATPASTDSITSSNGQEDHVSMGANAATKCYRIVQNLQTILAIELICAAQALEMRKRENGNINSSPNIEKLLGEFRQYVPTLNNDRYLYNDIEQAIAFLDSKTAP
jgi:histidine ammonia-lyase